MAIHPAAVVDPAARIAADAEIGPFCVIGADVEIGARTRLISHVSIEGRTTMGEDNTFFPYTTIGFAPQDLKYKGEESETRIGHRNRVREFVSIHRGTAGGGMLTSIGDDNLLMAYAHIAHDARIGNHVVVGNGVGFAGHVVVEDWAWLGAMSGVHQFCRIGQHAIVGAGSIITQDILPFSSTVSPREVRVFGANSTGLERRGFSAERIEALHKAFRLLTRSNLNTSQAVERIRADVAATPEIDELLAFIQAAERGFVK